MNRTVVGRVRDYRGPGPRSPDASPDHNSDDGDERRGNKAATDGNYVVI